MASDHAGKLNTQTTGKWPKPAFSRPEMLQLLVLGLLYVAAAVEAMTLGHSKANADVIWPANGILLGMMLRAPRRMWGLYLLEVSILDYLVDIPFHFPLVIDTGWVLGAIVEMTVAIFLLQGRNSKNIDLMHNAPMVKSSVNAAPNPTAALLAPRPIPLNKNILQYQNSGHFVGNVLNLPYGLALSTELHSKARYSTSPRARTITAMATLMTAPLMLPLLVQACTALALGCSLQTPSTGRTTQSGDHAFRDPPRCEHEPDLQPEDK